MGTIFKDYEEYKEFILNLKEKERERKSSFRTMPTKKLERIIKKAAILEQKSSGEERKSLREAKNFIRSFLIERAKDATLNYYKN